MAIGQSRPASTTGFVCMWNGTVDGSGGFIDYSTGNTNVRDPKKIQIVAHDIRELDVKPTLRTNGYQLHPHTTAVTTEELLAANTDKGRKVIEQKYFSECGEIVQKLTGAKVVIPYISRFRESSATPQEQAIEHVVDQRAKLGTTVSLAHVDLDRYTLYEGLGKYFGEEGPVLFKKYKRIAQVNVWRPVGKPVQKWPLLLVDHSAVDRWDYDTHCGHSLAINDPRIPARGPKSRDALLKHDPGYMYRYASDMSPDEVLVFSSGDTNAKMVTPHGAFWDDTTADDAAPRHSIEVRCWVFFEE
ncbi:Oxidoreductase R1 [Paramyrothecium foliicola]|nr:Oxidoreductase R1 [Paramyrothecium foliicola]